MVRRKKTKKKNNKKSKNQKKTKNNRIKENNSFTEEEIINAKELLSIATEVDEKNKENTFRIFCEDLESKLEEFINNELDYKNDLKAINDKIDDELKSESENSENPGNIKEFKENDEIKKTNIEKDINQKKMIKHKILKQIDLDVDDMINNSIAEKQYKGYNLIYTTEYNDKTLEDYEEYIIYNKKVFKKHKRQTKYYKDKGKHIEIYKCKNSRKNEKERVKAKLGEFCNAKIKKETNNNKKYIYEIINQHSLECNNNIKDNKELYDKPIKELTIYKNKCFEQLNNFKEYNRAEMKKSMSDLYNMDKYNFSLTPNMLNNILNEWKKYSNKFNKYNIFENQKNYDGEQFLKKYTYQYIETENKKDRKLIENIIWADDASISRLRESKNWMIDSTYHHPKEFSQLLIIYYKDIISKEKYPCFYVLTPLI